MENFWDFSVWGSFNLVALLLVSLIVANILKKLIKPLENSLIPTSVLGGILLLIASTMFSTPAADNLVYQNFPAIVFGFPMMLLATFAPKQPFWTMIILIGFFIAMNVILFRNQIFGGLRARRKDVADTGAAEEKSAAGEGSDETSAE